MTAVLKSTDKRKDGRQKSHAARLKALSEEAESIRRLHMAGKITSQEASKRLDSLLNRSTHFWDPFF